MNSEDLLILLGKLAREEEEDIEDRWDAIERASSSEQERARGAWAAGDAAPVERLTTPLTPEERERVWARIEALLQGGAKGPP